MGLPKALEEVMSKLSLRVTFFQGFLAGVYGLRLVMIRMPGG